MTKPVAKKAWVWLWLSALVIALDQITKYLVVHHLEFGQPVKILPFFNFTLNYNPGAAFSFLGAQGGWQVYLFAAISLIVAVILLVWLGRIKRSDGLMAAGVSLIIGGALGNFIDRIRLTYVIDFLDFHIKSWHYATFNVADSAICVGAFLLILRMLLSPRKKNATTNN